jgi:hypothetical protein
MGVGFAVQLAEHPFYPPPFPFKLFLVQTRANSLGFPIEGDDAGERIKK